MRLFRRKDNINQTAIFVPHTEFRENLKKYQQEVLAGRRVVIVKQSRPILELVKFKEKP